MSASRLVIVSNRLPVTARLRGSSVELEPAGGGLATGLGPWHARSGGRWVGWPGDTSTFPAAERRRLAVELDARGIVPVQLSADQIERYYHGFSNRVLWPLLHYLVDRVPVHSTGWEAYRRVNELFAQAVVDTCEPDDTIWVHDYQLMLVPALVRSRLPDARIGFFLHTPFPSAEVFRVLPWRRQILQGLLGADLIGFHTSSYLRHFIASLLEIEDLATEIDRVRCGDRDVRLGVFPMGIDAPTFDADARDPAVVAEAAAIRRDAGGRRIILGVDRLDYTKGIPRRLAALQRLFDADPALRDTVRYVQVAVPSRGGVETYQTFRRQVEEMVGRINGSSATLRSTPIHYLHQSLAQRQLVALYGAADVMLVTPLRDGMNLVAKEFVASRVSEDGVLVLSELAGAAAELGDAVMANPYDVDGVASAIRDALSMPVDEARTRMRGLRRQVMTHDVHRWADRFLEALHTAGPGRACARDEDPRTLAEALATARTRPVHLFLDYDGTLAPIAETPERAAPDAALMTLLEALAGRPGTELTIVSGRRRDTLDAWFGRLPVSLWAEHGYWHRPGPDGPWQAASIAGLEHLVRLRPILEQFTAITPGSFIETKSAGFAWHYRAADARVGPRQARELRVLLGDVLGHQPLEVVEGHKVIEVRVRGVSKALAARRAFEHAGDVIVAIGDDRTDEDLFRALPASSITISVGRDLPGARYRLAGPEEVRALLSGLLEPASASGTAAAALATPAFAGRG